jgi:protein-S-isoprenylcysteine O-methyltransferase Ste14
MADLRDRLFTMRSYTPIPFLVLGLIFGQPTIVSIVSGLVVSIIGEMIRFWGVGHATSETRVTGSVGASRLVVSGPFGHVRNPLYVGNILLYTGFGVMANLLWLIALTLAWFLFQYAMIISREEEFLAGKFGEEYDAYRRNVHRFIPRITSYKRDGSLDWGIAFRSERRTFQAFGIALLLMVARLVVWGGR